YVPRHPRDLPPFPTRRSSDLPPRPRFGLDRCHLLLSHAEVSVIGKRNGPPPLGNLPHGAEKNHHAAARRRADLLREHAIVNRFIDRKSTRLNSSHVAISYAVF